MKKPMKKKILFVNNTMGRAGAEVALIELIKKLLETGRYEIYLYVIIPQGELWDRIPKEVHILNRKVSRESVHSRRGRVAIAKRTMKAFFYRLNGFGMMGQMLANAREQKKNTGRIQPDKVLWRLLAEGTPPLPGQYDLAVAYIEGASAYFLADHVKARKKAAFIHIDYKEAGYTPSMDQGCYEKVDQIFTVSKEVGRKFCEVYPCYREKVSLFHNILDAESIREKAKGKGFEDGYEGLRLVTMGRLHYQKAYDIAIEACARILRDGYQIRWYILGEGPERASLEKMIQQHGIGDSFILMGAKDNPYPYVSQADIYVHATRFEGKSIAIEEAQILGRPIVASDCTGNTEQIEDGVDGILLSLNVENLVSTLERVIDSPQLRKEISENVSKKEWSFQKELRKLETLLT
jgi:glycosyltransferase involved in cell wall biosynthesis